jgi:WD40 repeat protein
MARMSSINVVLLGLCLGVVLIAQERHQATTAPEATGIFPGSDFVLQDKDLGRQKPQNSRVVLGTDGKGGTTVAVYGGSSEIQVSTLSFSGDGRLLAVGSTPGRVDLWEVETRKKLWTIEGGSTVGLSPDGRLLANDGKDGSGIKVFDAASGKLQRSIPRVLKRAENTIEGFAFSPDGSLLNVTANGDEDTVYDVSLGKLLVTLSDTKYAQFSKDGSLLIGGNARHLIVWNTKNWTKVRDLSRGPDYVRRIAVFPERDLVAVGGPKVALLQRLSSGEEIATLGEGFTNFLSFNPTGALVFTYSAGSGFVVWDIAGKRYCTRQNMGSTLALSADGRWLAAGSNSGTAVSIWNMRSALGMCGAASGR